ncbi:hypothetical protein BN1723_005238 [Verticillium longisporum]|uniref:Uncharacterized protein n=1 Tax=Verticillium longisporum TaxID=100787 RepID=A0A0G4N6Q6_VERLO|nr:hypothetical protein BN1723_005238 [Verticillium longisporum]
MYPSDRDLASAVGNVLDLVVLEGVDSAEGVGARGLIADGEVELADLIVADGADGVGNVVEDVVLAGPGVGVRETGRNIVHAVGGGERQLAVVKEILALGHGDDLVVHVDAAAHVGGVGGGGTKGEVVPGIVGDVMGAGRGVDAQQVEAAAAVGDLDAEVVAARSARPVGDTVGIDLAAKDADGRRVLVVGGDGGRALGGTARRDAGAGDKSGRGGEKGSDGGEHVDGREGKEARRSSFGKVR